MSEHLFLRAQQAYGIWLSIAADAVAIFNKPFDSKPIRVAEVIYYIVHFDRAELFFKFFSTFRAVSMAKSSALWI